MTIYLSPDDGICSGQKCWVKFFYLIQYHLQIPLVIPIISRVFSTIYKNRLIFNLAYLILLTVMMVYAKKEGFTKYLTKILSNTIAIKACRVTKVSLYEDRTVRTCQKAMRAYPEASISAIVQIYPKIGKISALQI